MPHQVERRALLRAMEFHGGAAGLARLLDASAAQVERWSDGTEPVPPAVFMKIVDLVIEHDVAELRRGAPGAAAKVSPMRVRFHGRAGKARGAAWHPVAHPFFEPAFAPKSKKELLCAALDAAMKVAGTDLATLQLAGSGGTLRMQAQHGFSKPFLDFFQVVQSGQGSVAGLALGEHRQIFVPDVRQDPSFAGTVSGSMLLEAGVRAVVCSPIPDQSGTAVGVLSTHYRTPPSADAANLDGQLQIAERVGGWLRGETSRPS